MASSYTTSLKLTQIGNGEQSGVWGTTTNTNWALIEQAVAGVQTITMLNANYTLTDLNGVSDEARNAVLVVQGTNSAIRQIVAPLVNKVYIVSNQTTGGYAINIGGATGSVVSIPNGYTSIVYCDGVNFYYGNTGLIGNQSINGNLNVSGTLGVTGNTTLSGTLGVTGNTTVSGALTATGGVTVGANAAPTFSANVTGSGTQTFVNNAWTKAQFPNEEWDTNNNYDNTTNYRFTPTVAGYYQINACVSLNGSFATEIAVAVYKNGSRYKVGTDLSNSSVAFGYGQTVNVLVQMNGTTDYVEIYLYQSSGADRSNITDPSLFYFQAAFVRSL